MSNPAFNMSSADIPYSCEILEETQLAPGVNGFRVLMNLGGRKTEEIIVALSEPTQ